MASWFDGTCNQDYLCEFGAILMFHYGVVVEMLKQVAQIWHPEITAVKNYT